MLYHSNAYPLYLTTLLPILASRPSVKPSPSSRSPAIFPRPSHYLSHLGTTIPNPNSTSLALSTSTSLPLSTGLSLPLKDGMPLSSTMLFSQGLSGGTLTLGGGIGSLSALSPAFGRTPSPRNMNGGSAEVSNVL